MDFVAVDSGELVKYSYKVLTLYAIYTSTSILYFDTDERTIYHLCVTLVFDGKYGEKNIHL